MSTSKTLALAAFTALSLGMGTAMAQSDGPSAPDPNYGPAQQFYGAPPARILVAPAVQSGSSDVGSMHTTGFDYGTLANPG